MKLIKPYTEILSPINSEEILKMLERVARTCYKSEDKITDDSAIEMMRSLIKRDHLAMIEFFDITVKFVCDRGISHELVRHRIASFAQESTRYCNYSKDKFDNQITFITPCWIRENWSEECGDDNATAIWYDQMQNAESAYNNLINEGWQPQQARSVLPNSLKTEINVKMNLREWRHFFKLRCSPAAHPQMRELTIPLLKEFQSKISIIFDDITY
jgi:thymidylate synthase (FAD)